jgi:molecular chaperone Hsp33
MLEQDNLQRFLFKDAHIRGEIVRLNKAYNAITERHPYPLPVQQFLGQALAASALLSATIKFSGRLTLQIQSDGPINLLVVQSNEQFYLRGLAKWQAEQEVNANFADAFGKGQLAITIVPTEGERYQGIVSLNSNSLASSLENYFHQSEQLPTCLCLFANDQAAAGILLQAMPSDTTEDRYQFWEHLIHLTRTLTVHELMALSNQTVLKRLYPEEDIVLFDAEPVTFRCDCSITKMERALLVMGEQEANTILQTNQHITVTCEFCHYHYNFDKADVARLFADDITTLNPSEKH